MLHDKVVQYLSQLVELFTLTSSAVAHMNVVKDYMDWNLC